MMTSLCRHCRAPQNVTMADLGATPIANDYLNDDALERSEPWYPLRVFYCDTCHLVQLQDFVRAQDVFRANYAYFSSQSRAWVQHAEEFVDAAINRFELTPLSHVVEIASNDGYLLKHVIKRGRRATGIEPCHSVADHARRTHGVPTLERFFGDAEAKRLLDEIGPADFIVANNVLAHVPDILDFAKGFAVLLEQEGVASFEFPHLLNLIDKVQFDTIYHEHFSYLSLLAVENIFKHAGLRVFDVETLSTHGGSLRLYACRDDASHQESVRVDALRRSEREFGIDRAETYQLFQSKIDHILFDLVTTLITLKRAGKRIAAYGAPAKGNTLLNVAGVRSNLISFTVDSAPAKQNMYLPGSRIPIYAPEKIFSEKPDIVVILPWNLEAELIALLRPIGAWGGKVLIPAPMPRLVDLTS